MAVPYSARMCSSCFSALRRLNGSGMKFVFRSPLKPTSCRGDVVMTPRAFLQTADKGRTANPDSLLETLKSYWNLKWFPIPASVGFAVLCYLQFRHVRDRERRKIETSKPADLVATPWQVNVLRILPLKAMSRLAGSVSDTELPSWIRIPVLKAFVWKYNCQLSEAEYEDLNKYPTIGAFFQRTLKPVARPIDQEHHLVSPVDGKVLHLGTMTDGVLEQVKGISYSLGTFLGDDQTSQLQTGSTGDSQVYHCVMYLAPGDCHWFHSPTEWTVKLRRHFPGELFSVSPGVARVIAGLFNYNERVVLIGHWKYGYFALAAVGATNVGSIKINFDEELKTNVKQSCLDRSYYDKAFSQADVDGVSGLSATRGQSLGGFRLGSTIVLVFEAPKDFQFCVQPGDKIQYGQPLGTLPIVKSAEEL